MYFGYLVVKKDNNSWNYLENKLIVNRDFILKGKHFQKTWAISGFLQNFNTLFI